MKTMFGSSLPSGDPGLISYLRYLCLFEFSGVQHVLCCFVFLVSPVPYVGSFSVLFFNVPSVFDNVYIEIYVIWRRHEKVQGTMCCEQKWHKISNGTWFSRSTIFQLHRRLHLINLTRKNCIQ